MISDPTASVSSPAAGSAPQTSGASATDVAYASLSPASVPNGESAIIRNRRTAARVTTAIVDGGFDPVPIPARAGDTIDLLIRILGTETPMYLNIVVPRAAKPRVIRTYPPTRKRDVVLNTAPQVIFSEPIDSATLTDASIRLRQGAGNVPGRWEFPDGNHLAVSFLPDQALKASTDYRLEITTTVRDLDGEELDASVAVEFTTGSLEDPPAAILVDASHDGGVWWFPQYPAYDPGLPHQGQRFAEYLRSLGFAVDELGRGTRITDDILSRYTRVIRASSCRPYSDDELSAYRSFLSREGTLFLIGDHLGNPACAPDGLAEALGISFSGSVGGTVTRFAEHPITAGVRNVSYEAGSVLVRYNADSVEVIGWLGTDQPVMGVLRHPSAKIFFMGDLNNLESVPQPLVDNLVEWGLCSDCIARGALRVLTTTTGTSLDPDGYTVCVDQADGADCAVATANGSLTIPRLSSGGHTVRLSGVADPCVVLGTNPRPVEISTGATTDAAFQIDCSVEVLVPYGAAGYRFRVLQDSTTPNSDFESLVFNDSLAGFLDGQAAFGSGDAGCSPTPSNTDWPVETDLLLRRVFDLPSGVRAVVVSVAIDNDVQLFVNGVDLTAAGVPSSLEGRFQQHEGCAERDSFVFAVPDTLVHAGANLLAVRARDRGGESYVDLRVTAQRP